ncbi:hypothetical protein F4780DRAFT_693013 [Xylariomycetidae sp. FL0641]|nr:hypothetical protein F4780DRAFT_693013 [Xylariomycetidae sp. FL0641]
MSTTAPDSPGDVQGIRNTSYGAVSGRVATDLRRHLEATDSERAALLADLGSPARPSKTREYFTQPLSCRHADLVLLFSYAITGLLDSAATATWGAFVSMQTGNTVYLALGLASDPSTSTRWIKSLLSIGGFCLGSFCFGHLHIWASTSPLSPSSSSSFSSSSSPSSSAALDSRASRARWVVLVSATAQLALMLVAAVMVTLGPPAPTANALQPSVVVPLLALSAQSSGQAVLSRALDHPALISVVLTTIYCDLFADPGLLRCGARAEPDGAKADRARRAAAPVFLLVGALIGGALARSSAGNFGALWTAVLMKAILVGVWALWKGEEVKAGEDDV